MLVSTDEQGVPTEVRKLSQGHIVSEQHNQVRPLSLWFYPHPWPSSQLGASAALFEVRAVWRNVWKPLCTCVCIHVYRRCLNMRSCRVCSPPHGPAGSHVRGFAGSRCCHVILRVSGQKPSVFCPNYSSQEIKLGGKSCTCLMRYS